MKSFWRRVLKGLGAVLPLMITLYALVWILATLESIMGGLFKIVFPDILYIPGVGIIGGVVVFYVIGRLVERRQIVHRLTDFAERQMERVPLVKTIYGGIRDLIRFFSMAKEGEKGGREVVLATLAENIRLIGLTTGNAADQLGLSPDEDTVAVYLPMSYQMGGFTVYVPRASTKSLDMGVEEALRVVLTAGMARSEKREGE